MIKNKVKFRCFELQLRMSPKQQLSEEVGKVHWQTHAPLKSVGLDPSLLPRHFVVVFLSPPIWFVLGQLALALLSGFPNDCGLIKSICLITKVPEAALWPESALDTVLLPRRLRRIYHCTLIMTVYFFSTLGMWVRHLSMLRDHASEVPFVFGLYHLMDRTNTVWQLVQCDISLYIFTIHYGVTWKSYILFCVICLPSYRPYNLLEQRSLELLCMSCNLCFVSVKKSWEMGDLAAGVCRDGSRWDCFGR